MARKIEPKMVAWLDAKLTYNGLAQNAIETKDARLLMRLAAEACVGIREVGGNNAGPMVELIQETVGGADRESWCMSFVQTMIAYAEFKLSIKSAFPVTEHCLTSFVQAPSELHVSKIPAPGAICIWKHGKTSNGHTGIVLNYGSKSGIMNLVEGNTEKGLKPDVTIEHDGSGVYYTKRSIDHDGDMKVVGFLKPF